MNLHVTDHARTHSTLSERDVHVEVLQGFHLSLLIEVSTKTIASSSPLCFRRWLTVWAPRDFCHPGEHVGMHAVTQALFLRPRACMAYKLQPVSDAMPRARWPADFLPGSCELPGEEQLVRTSRQFIQPPSTSRVMAASRFREWQFMSKLALTSICLYLWDQTTFG